MNRREFFLASSAVAIPATLQAVAHAQSRAQPLVEISGRQTGKTTRAINLVTHLIRSGTPVRYHSVAGSYTDSKIKFALFPTEHAKAAELLTITDDFSDAGKEGEFHIFDDWDVVGMVEPDKKVVFVENALYTTTLRELRPQEAVRQDELFAKLMAACSNLPISYVHSEKTKEMLRSMRTYRPQDEGAIWEGPDGPVFSPSAVVFSLTD